MKSDNFIDIPFSPENIDLYIVRTSILKALTNSLPKFSGRLLDVGCGKMPYREFIRNNSSIVEYIGLDIDSAIVYDNGISPDFQWDGITMPFEENSFDCVMATEVLEHCFETKVILNEIHRVLKPGGTLFLTVPFLWPLHEVPHDAYRYTPFNLERVLSKSGFTGITLTALGGWDASLAQMIGLWARRRPLSHKARTIVSWFARFVVKYIYQKDKPPVVFGESTMITGISGLATKRNNNASAGNNISE